MAMSIKSVSNRISIIPANATTAKPMLGKKELMVMSADIFRPVYLVELATVIICFRRMPSLIIRNIRNILKMLFVRHIEKGKT